MNALLGTVLFASLAGSLHCAGMCGGLVACYSGGPSGSRGQAWLGHLAYNGGRLMTYLTVGALFGALGAAVDIAGTLGGVSRLAALLGGSVMIVAGLVVIARSLGLPIPVGRLPPRLQALLGQALGRVRAYRPSLRALLLGLLSALLPCGWLYAFAALAAGTGGPVRGMAVMLAFWVGTVPMLLGLGVSVRTLSAPLLRRLPTLTAVTLIIVGTLWVAGRSIAPAPAAACHDPAAIAVGAAAERPAAP